MNLTLYKNEIIPVYTTDLGNKVVNARELHAFLNIGRDFSTWLKDRIKEHKLVENQDFCLLPKNGENTSTAGRKRIDYLIRLHAAKKIALGTNNEKGDQIKDYFIKCEEIVQRITTSESFDANHYIGSKNQKQLVKNVAGVLYAQNGEPTDLIKHHQDNCKLHFGVKPSELKAECIKNGLKVKSKSGREIARIIKPESACSMAVHDDFVAQGHSLEKLKDVQLREKLEPAFKVVMDLGFTPKQLLR